MNGFDSYQLEQRATVARLIFAVAFVVLVAAFFRVQVLQHDKYELQAETNRLRPLPLLAPRGEILDYKGRLIAENQPGYAVKLLAPREDSLRAVLARLGQIVPLDSAQVQQIIVRYRGARYQPVVVFGNADFALISVLEEHRAQLPGLVIASEPRRRYPAGKAVAHVVGYVGEVTESDLEQKRFPGAELGAIVGRAGIERQYDSTLRGRQGVRYIEVNARGRLVREAGADASYDPVAGEPLRTTIDLDLQQYIDSIWPPGVRGAMLAMTADGEIRALYSAPSFDPNVFVGGISGENWRMLNGDSAKPLLNRAVYGRYPPASPFKLATAAMALRRGIIQLDTHMPISCSGGMQLGNRYFRCWKKEGHGNLDLKGAVAQSCDVYFYQVGLRLGLRAIVEDGVLMGFRDKSGVDLPSEQSPIYPASTAYFDKLYGPRRWSPPATTLNFSIGQGENTQTLANMVRFYQALANGGSAPPPHIVRPLPGAQPRTLGLNDEQVLALRRALIAVVEQGTAARTRSKDLIVAGKTGTAQNSHGKDHGWFIGFAPADKPQIVVGAIMEFAEHGSSVAPYVVKAIRRYVVGPEAVPGPTVQVNIPVDSAPREVPLPEVPESLRTPVPAPAPTAPAPRNGTAVGR